LDTLNVIKDNNELDSLIDITFKKLIDTNASKEENITLEKENLFKDEFKYIL
jgi:hypothetical protein